jgi:hypothetical protein
MTDAFFSHRIYRRLATVLRQKEITANKGGSRGRYSASLVPLAVDIAVITCDKNEQYVLITAVLSTFFKQSGRNMVEGMRCIIGGTWLEGGRNHYQLHIYAASTVSYLPTFDHTHRMQEV